MHAEPPKRIQEEWKISYLPECRRRIRIGPSVTLVKLTNLADLSARKSYSSYSKQLSFPKPVPSNGNPKP